MFYYNQRDYSYLSYPSKNHTGATISSSGCGVCAMAMAVNNLAGKELYTVKTMRDLAINNGARELEGTNVVTLIKAVIKQHNGFSYTTTNSEDALKNHLENGGIAIANQGDSYDVFSSAGHFVTAIGYGTNVQVLDPYLYNGKYNRTPRVNRIVRATNYGCIVSYNEMGKATADRTPAYLLIKYDKAVIKPTNTLPNFNAGSNYILTADMFVREGAGVECNVKKVKDLTADAKKHSVYKTNSAKAILKTGTVVTAQKVYKIGNDIWLKIPSGYIAVFYKGNKYANWYRN